MHNISVRRPWAKRVAHWTYSLRTSSNRNTAQATILEMGEATNIDYRAIPFAETEGELWGLVLWLQEIILDIWTQRCLWNIHMEASNARRCMLGQKPVWRLPRY